MLHNFERRVLAACAGLLSRKPSAAESGPGRSLRLRFESLEPRLVLDAGPAVISEFLALNDRVYPDRDGDFSDWIEIHNPTDSRIDLGGWYLTDDRRDLEKWRFPVDVGNLGRIDPGDYLVVFASGKDPNGPPGELHTNFQLDSDGEYLALVRADGTTVAAVVWRADGGIIRLVGLPGVSDASARALGVSADGSVIVGSLASHLSQEAFRWTVEGGMVPLGELPGGGYGSSASDVSAEGSIVVGASASDRGVEAFLWTSEGGMVGLGDLPGGSFQSGARGVSADGAVIVGSAHPWGPPVSSTAFIWEPTRGMRNLQEALSVDYALDLTGWELTSAIGVSDDGLVIVGHGVNPAGDDEAWRAVIAEPSSAVLAVSALLALLAYAWRKRRRAAFFD